MSYKLYYHSLEDATLTYSATADTGYPITNMQDRNINTFFKDSSIASGSVTLKIDFGESVTRDYILLGNYIASSVGAVTITLKRSSTGAFAGEETTVFSDETISSATLTNKIKTFTSCTNQYWQITLSHGDTCDYQIGTIFLGSVFTFVNNPKLELSHGSNFNVTVNQSGGGVRYSQIINTAVRRIWNLDFILLNSTEKTGLETFRDEVQTSDLSRWPFYFSPDSGTTLYFVRKRGDMEFTQRAFGAWDSNFIFEEEL